MARTDNLTNFLTDVAGAIKTKKGSSTAIAAEDFDTEILALPSQGTYQTKSITVTTDGSVSVLPEQGYDAIEQLTVTTNVTNPEYELDLALTNEILAPYKPYKQLEYIQSTGTQWIDTGVYGKTTTGIDMKFRQLSSTSYSGIFGGRTSYYANGFTYFNTDVGSTSKKLFQMANAQNSITLTDVAPYYFSVDTTLTINNGHLTLTDGTYTSEYTNTAASTPFTTVYTIYLFGVNDHGTLGDSYKYNLRVYYFKIYDGETLVRHLIPVQRKSDNVVCMYDLVTNEFFTNQGTGSFTAGPVIS